MKNRKVIICLAVIAVIGAVGIGLGINHSLNVGDIQNVVINSSGDVPVVQTATQNNNSVINLDAENSVRDPQIDLSLDAQVAAKQEELKNAEGMYCPDTIVLADTTKKRAKSLAKKLGAKVRMTKQGDFAVLYLPEGTTIDDVYADEEFRVELLEMTPDYTVRAADVDALGRELMPVRPQYEVTDTNYSSQSYLDYIDLQDVWSRTKGAGVKIAVIDTGIDTDNPEFAGRISSLSYNASDDKTVADYGIEQIEDEQGHGTAVTGVMAANMDGKGITGIAPEAEIIVIKCECDESGTFVRGSDLVFGLAYAIEVDADVVNMSFGGLGNPYSKYTKLAVDSDVICVAGAGNDGTSIPFYPAADENVIGVGSLGADVWTLASYSNFGDNSDIVAPGTTYTTLLGGEYGYKTGTSLASPITAATIALYLSEHKHTEYSRVCEMLEASSTDLGSIGEDWYYGFGALDAAVLLNGEVGTITYDMQTDEINDKTQIFIRGHAVQKVPEPEREDVVFDGWYTDPECEDECDYYTQIFTNDTTLYAGWINEDEGTAYIYNKQSDGTIEITSYTGRRKYLTVPESIDGMTVTRIGEGAFANNQRIRSVILPSSIRSIGDMAFNYCTMLRGMDIPDGVETIGNRAFEGCPRLTSVGIAPKGKLSYIGDDAFAMCSISSFHIPSELSYLGVGTFLQSTSMRSITVESGNTHFTVKNNALYDSLGTTLIYYPAGLTGTYKIPASTKTINDYAFASCRAVQIDLPDGLNTIRDNAFLNCSIRSIVIPASVTSVGEKSFSCCYTLENVIFADGCNLTIIPKEAFGFCSQLNSINIPDSVQTIGSNAFSCTNIKNIAFGKQSKLAEIKEYAFEYSNLEKIILPDSLTSIGIGAFCNCTNLNSVKFDSKSNCSVIEMYAFEKCVSLKSLNLPDSLTELGDRALYRSGLESIHIGAGLTAIGEGTLGYCQNLEEISVSSDNPSYSAFDGMLYDHDQTILLACPAARRGAVSTAGSTEQILGYAFSGTDKLTSVTFNAGLKEIGQFAFEDSGIQTPELPQGLLTINESAFINCQGMTNKLLIPKTVISLGRKMVYGDANLTEIEVEADSDLSRVGYGTFSGCGIETFTIPENVSSLGQEIFSDCKNLITVTFEADNKVKNLAAWTFTGADNLRRITFEDGCALTLIEARACESISSLDKIDLSACLNLETIDNYAFRNCSSLNTVLLPESLKEIGRYAFAGCKSLRSLDIPASVEFIGRYAFYGTEGMNLYFKSSVLPLDLQQNWDYDLAGYYLDVKDQIESGDWVYALTSDGQASVISYRGSASIINLDKIDGYDVVSIGGEAFKGNGTLQSITLPDTLKSICKGAFQNTTALQTVTLPVNLEVIDANAFKGSNVSTIAVSSGSSLRMIGRYAFANTPNLTSFNIPDGVKTLSDYAFYNSAVTAVSFSGTPMVETIGKYAFAKSGLQSIVIPDSVTLVDDDAFREASALKSVTFGSGTELKLSAQAFYGCGLESVDLPANVNIIEELCFTNCSSLTNISVAQGNEKYSSNNGVLFNKEGTVLITCPAGKTGTYSISSNVSRLSFAAFEGSRLSKINIPDGNLNTIGYRAFFRCENLKTITIPAGVQSIDNYAFAYDKNLESVNISTDSRLGGIYKSAFYNCEKLSSINIPDTAQEIGDYSFYGCTALSNVGISSDSHLKTISDHAFEYTGIINFEMPEEVIEVGNYAFRGSKLKTFIFNDVIQELGDFALAYSEMTDTKKLVLPSTLEYVGRNVLEGVQGIEDLTLPFLGSDPEEDDIYNATLKYTLGYNSFSDAMNQYSNLKKITVLGGKIIGVSAFEGIPAQYISLPDSCTQIESMVFSNCCSLRQVVLPENLEKIPYSTFNLCTSLTHVDIPSSCKVIEEQAFYGCQSLKSITIPASVNMIEDDVFTGCDNLMSINIENGNKWFKSVSGVLYDYDTTKLIIAPRGLAGVISIPEGVKTIGSGAFSSCKDLETVIMPETLVKVDKHAFRFCESLNNVVWSKKLEIIGEGAFSDTKLEEIVLPNSVISIGNQAFMGNQSLKRVKLPDYLEELAWDLFLVDYQLEEVIIGQNVKSIGIQCFMGCDSLTNIVLPDSVEEIMVDAFRNCIGLETFYISKNINTIESGVFSGCSKLASINVDEENEYFCSQDGILYDKKVTKLLYVPAAISGVVSVKSGIKEIEPGAFSGNNGITGIVLPDSIEKIGDNAFFNCKSLEDITFGENIKEIGEWCFEGTPYAEDTDNWYDGIVYVGKYAVGRGFYTLPKTVKIKEGTVLLCKNLFNSVQETEVVYLPDSVKYINDYAFFYAQSISKIRLGKNVESIGKEAFRGCFSITSLNLVNKNLETGEYPFFECKLEYVRTNKDYPITIGNNGRIITYVGAFSFNTTSAWVDNLVIENEKQLKNSTVDSNSVNDLYVRLEADNSELQSRNFGDVKVYTLGEWNLATFYVNDMIVTMNPLKRGEVVHEPAANLVSEYLPEGATFMGWDINGDGSADTLPATLTEDLEATAIYNSPIVSISVIESYKNIEVGESTLIHVKKEPTMYTQDETLTWTSSDKSIVKVTSSGKITGVSAGVATVKVALKNNNAIFSECTVFVIPKEYGIKLKETEGEVNIGETITINADVIVPEDYAYSTKYTSNDKSIATVDSKGVVTGVNAGKTSITVSCGEYSAEFNVSVIKPITSVSLETQEGRLALGDTKKLDVVFEPVDTTDDKNILWYSNDTSIAKVDSTGTITGVGPGTTEIIGVIGEFKVTYTVTVDVPIKSVLLNTTTGTMRLDKTKQLEMIFTPADTTDDKTVVWSSEDPSIASVSDSGLVAAISRGKTKITGTVLSGTDNEKSASYTVTVVGLRDANTGIVVTNSDDSEMDEATDLKVSIVDEDEVAEAIENCISDTEELERVSVYDIELNKGGETVQPETKVDVEIPSSNDFAGEEVAVYRVEDNGKLTNMRATLKDGKYLFQTDHFSTYVIGVRKHITLVGSIQLPETLSLCPGASGRVEVTLSPANADNKDLTWSSSNTDVAVVDENGSVTAISEGVTIITAEAKDKTKLKATCEVFVGHDWSEWTVVNEASEDEEGLEARVCHRDPSHKEERVIPTPSHTHEIVKVERKEPTCSVNGNIEYWTCSLCHKLYQDASGSTEITAAETVIEATGHSEEIIPEVDPTCTKTGRTEGRICTECGKIIIPQTTIATLSHEYTAIVVEPTCTVGGYTVYTCANCSDYYTADETPAKGHTFGEWILDKDSTCTDEGSSHRECSVCGFTETEGVEKKAHNFSPEWTVDKEPTCTEDGSKSIHCLNEGCKVAVGSQVIPALGHSYVDNITKQATVDHNGNLEEKCERCGKVRSTTTIKKVKAFKLSTSTYVFNGKAKKPTVTVTDTAGKKLVNGTDYKVTYASGRKAIGKYKVTVSLKGKYSGSKTLYFTIKPTAAKGLKLTTPKSKQLKVSYSKASGGVSYQIWYRVKGTSNWKKTTSTGTSKLLKNLKGGKTYQVKVRAYKKVDGTTYTGAWTAIKSLKVKK